MTTAEEVWESARAEGSKLTSQWGWGIFWNGPSREDDLLRQIQIMEKQVDAGVAGIILAPDHAVALISSVRAANERKIPVVILDNPLAASPKQDVLFVLNDNAAMGRIAAERASPYLNGAHNEVAVVGVSPNFLGTIVAADTIRAELQRHDSAVRIIEQSPMFGPTEAEESADEMLHSHPALRVIITLNVNQTRAVYHVLLRAKMLGKVALIGCEQDFDLIYHVRTGDIDAVIAKDTRMMVRDAMRWLRERREGSTTGHTLLVTPTLITKQNVDSAEIQEVLAVNGGT